MKKLIILLSCVICACSLNAKKIFNVPESCYQQVKDLGDPKLENEKSSSVILLGDTQCYTHVSPNTGILNIMLNWIAFQREALNISAVFGVGDIVQVANLPEILGKVSTAELVKGSVKDGLYRQRSCYNRNSTQQWQAISDAFKVLDNKVAYFIATGNHDHGKVWGDGRPTRFNEFFTPERNMKNLESLMLTGKDENNKNCLQNAIYKLDVDNAWGEVYVMGLEFKPRQEVLNWAKKTIESKKYKGKRFIILTHAFINQHGVLSNDDNYKMKGVSAYKWWDSFVKNTPEITAIFCVHHCDNNNAFEQSTCFKTFKNESGGNVHAMMFNPQTIGGGFSGNGGDGWLRILEFMPDGETIKVKTYSPFFGISPMTKHFAWRVADFDMFEFKLDK